MKKPHEDFQLPCLTREYQHFAIAEKNPGTLWGSKIFSILGMITQDRHRCLIFLGDFLLVTGSWPKASSWEIPNLSRAKSRSFFP
jgi:hypothetical protein